MATKKKVAFFEIKEWEKEYLKKQLKNFSLLFYDEPLTVKNTAKAKDCDAISVFIYSVINEEILKKLPKLKFVATRSTGFDHIDLVSCEKRNITVCNVPTYGDNTVAEHTFGLILSLSRNIHKSYVRTLQDDFSIEGLTGFDLKGKTIGIIGGGNIGLHVAKMAKGFGMNVLVFDPVQQKFVSELIDFKYRPLNDLLKESDIISLHVPLNEKTFHLINKKNIRLVKKGAYIINTSRGRIIDTDALFESLSSGHLGGAGLDVIEGVKLMKDEQRLLHSPDDSEHWRQIIRDHKIFKMDNVVFTMHNAFNSREALKRILDTTISNLQGYITQAIINPVKSAKMR